MSLTVATNLGSRPAPQLLPPSDIVRRAQQQGNARARAAIAITIPVIRIDQTGLRYRQRQSSTGLEFSFDTGRLTLTLRQELLLANVLSACARRKWTVHENLHVDDNRAVMGQMDAEIRRDAWLGDVFVRKNWFPRQEFDLVQRTIEGTVGGIFEFLTEERVLARDTIQEYRRIDRDILQNCPGPCVYEVMRGDTLTAIALHFYGNGHQWRGIYARNQRTIGSNPHLIRVGQRLEIPKQP